jgi:hypothetical protein
LAHLFLALLCSRLLASTRDPNISRRAYSLLREVRSVTRSWIRAVRDKLKSRFTQDETTREGLQQRLCMAAATCFSTFDVCPEHIPALLCNHEDFSIAIQCAIIVHDNTPPRSDHSLYLTKMLSRHRRLLHDLEPIFLPSDPAADPDQDTLLYPLAYDRALRQEWSDFRRSSSWQALPRPNSHWISCVTEGKQKVHYNLLTGQLLIDGKQLGRVPREIMEHPTYTSLLGTVSFRSQIILLFPPFLRHFQKIFDVVPADVPGMDYKTRFDVSGYKVRHHSPWTYFRGSDRDDQRFYSRGTMGI